MSEVQAAASQRLDKWLWSARFFKTRNLAIEAVNGGRVQVNGQRVKPARAVRPGDLIEVSRGETRMVVEVVALAARRGPASEARGLYLETEASREANLRRAEMHRLTVASSGPLSRPDKKQRRQLRQLRERNED